MCPSSPGPVARPPVLAESPGPRKTELIISRGQVIATAPPHHQSKAKLINISPQLVWSLAFGVVSLCFVPDSAYQSPVLWLDWPLWFLL